MALIYAHRGASAYAPENTLAAFRLAEQMHADGIELDVTHSKDGALVVIHDDLVDRTSNAKGFVWDYTLEELKALDFGSWFSPQYAGECLPTLDEVLAFIASSPLALNIEIKSITTHSDATLAKDVCDCILRYPRAVQDKLIISSFDHACLRDVLAYIPDAKTGLLYSGNLLNPGDYANACGATAIHPHYELIDSEGVINCIQQGINVNVWTVNTPEAMHHCQNLGCHTIITNYPDIARNLLK